MTVKYREGGKSFTYIVYKIDCLIVVLDVADGLLIMDRSLLARVYIFRDTKIPLGRGID